MERHTHTHNYVDGATINLALVWHLLDIGRDSGRRQSCQVHCTHKEIWKQTRKESGELEYPK